MYYEEEKLIVNKHIFFKLQIFDEICNSLEMKIPDLIPVLSLAYHHIFPAIPTDIINHLRTPGQYLW